VSVKIGDGNGIPYNSAVRGVEWAIENKDKFGIHILSNSWGLILGGPAYQNGESELSRLMDTAVEAGLVVFVSAGNTALSMTVYTPGDSKRAITVGSVNDDHVLSFFSSQGPTADGRIKPDVCAVGESVTAPRANSGNGYVTYDGTSMACPMAAGLAALMLQAKPDLEPDDVKQIMHETSEHNTEARFPTSPNNGYGWGVVEAYGAVKRSRDMAQTFLQGPPKVHEGDIISFTTNTTYTRTSYTYKGQDGMALIGDDEVFFKISIPASWSIPFNITVTSEGNMEPDIVYQVPRFENNMWVLEAEVHYTEDVFEPTVAIPWVKFQSRTPDVILNRNYTFFLNITLNEMNATKVTKNITVDNQDPPVVQIETPLDGDPVSGIVPIAGSAYNPDVGDELESVEIQIEDGDWQLANETSNWYYEWNTTELNNGWYKIRARAFDGENYSSIHNISVLLDNLNLQPIAIINSISPNPANEGEDVSFSGYGMDDDGYIVEFEWKSNIDGILSTEETFSSSLLSIGTHEISFRVKDNDGVWSQKDEFELRINQIPVAQIDLIYPNPANENELISFSGHGVDDRTIVAYNWRSNIDGFLSNLASFTSSSLTPENHIIYFRVQDDDGVWSEESAQTLRVNRIPIAYIDSMSPNPAIEDDVVNFVGHASDDGTIIAYEWISDIDGLLSEESSFMTNLSVGDHVISFRAEDNDYTWSNYVYQALKIKPKPTAFIDSISPNPVNESESVTFTGHGEEDVGEIINYSWRSDIDGWLSKSASFSTSTLSTGVHIIFFAVQNDNEVWSEDVTQNLRINGAPTAFIDSISPSPALQGEDVLFEGHGTDDTGIINYSWHSSIDGFLGYEASFVINQLSLGTHTISFKVQDSDYKWSSKISQTLRIHQKPRAYIDIISPNPANEGTDVTFVGHGSDDVAIVAYEWRSSKDNKIIGEESSFSYSQLSVGEHEISFKVMDSDGVWSDVVVRSLRINQIPIAFIDSVTPNPANEGDLIEFSGHGIDDRTIENYYWQSNIDGPLSFSSSFTTTTLSVGQHTIYFKVQDDDDVWSDEISITIRINQIPLAFIDPFPPNRVNEGDMINFVGYGVDDGNIVTYIWTSSIDGLLSNQKEFSLSNLTVGKHTISFAVKDDFGVWSKDVKISVRINQIPKAYIQSISPNPALSDESIQFLGYGQDDEEIAEYYWSSSLNGFLSNSNSFSWIGLSLGNHIISLKVRDQDDVWSIETYLMLKVHKKPTAKIKAVIPESPNEGEEITLIGEGKDDGYITTYYWLSSIDGYLGDQKELTLPLSRGVHTISLTVKDDLGIWSDKVERILHINGIPVAYIDSISPNPVEEGSTVTFTGHGMDEGSVIEYEWSSSRDGVLGSQKSLSISSLSVGNHNIFLKVRDDKGVWSEEATALLTVTKRINKAPTIELISPTKGGVVTDVILIEAEANDEDGDVEMIEARVDDNNWFRISDSYFAYYTLETEDMRAGNHVIYVRAYDGEDYSSEEFVLIRVEQDEGEVAFLSGDFSFLISIGLVILVIVVCVVSVYFLSRRNRRGPEFIGL